MMNAKKEAGKTATAVRKPAARKTAARKAAAPRAGAKTLASAAGTAGRSRSRSAAAAVKPSVAVALAADKPKKPKLVRDSFTIPKGEFMALQELKQRVGKAGVAAKKSEILRAGIKALAAMNDTALAAALAAVPAIKTGRPAKD